MRFYQSPISIGGIIFILVRIFVGIAVIILYGWGSLLSPYFLLPLIIGIALLWIDYFLRKSGIIAKRPSFKFYQSPLSIGGIIFIVVGIYSEIGIFFGGYPTYLFPILAILGISMLLADYFIRKSELELYVKIIIQTLIVLLPFITAYLFFTGQIFHP